MLKVQKFGEYTYIINGVVWDLNNERNFVYTQSQSQSISILELIRASFSMCSRLEISTYLSAHCQNKQNNFIRFFIFENLASLDTELCTE